MVTCSHIDHMRICEYSLHAFVYLLRSVFDGVLYPHWSQGNSLNLDNLLSLESSIILSFSLFVFSFSNLSVSNLTFLIKSLMVGSILF